MDVVNNMADDTPMKDKHINITEEQDDYLDEHHLKLSSLVRDMLDALIKSYK